MPPEEQSSQPSATAASGGRPLQILLVEDNPLDARATLKAADKLKLANQITHVTDGQEALDLLSGQSPPFDLVLLDLNLPGLDGRDVLSRIRSDADLRRTPVVILTTSSDEADVLGAYELGANAYVTKPVGLDGWMEVVSQIDGFWLSLVRLPSR